MKRNPFDDGELYDLDLWSGASGTNSYGACTTNDATTADWSLAKMVEAMEKARQMLAASQAVDLLKGATVFSPNPMLPLIGDQFRKWHSPLRPGIPVHPDKYLTVTRKPPTRRRRRLWRHWLATRQIPDPNVYFIAGQMLVGHPDTIARMAEALNRLDDGRPAPAQMEWKTTV